MISHLLPSRQRACSNVVGPKEWSIFTSKLFEFKFVKDQFAEFDQLIFENGNSKVKTSFFSSKRLLHNGPY